MCSFAVLVLNVAMVLVGACPLRGRSAKRMGFEQS